MRSRGHEGAPIVPRVSESLQQATPSSGLSDKEAKKALESQLEIQRIAASDAKLKVIKV